MSHFEKMTGSDFKRWIKSYDAAPLETESLPPSKTMNIASHCNVVICSPLARSIESSVKLGLSDKMLVSSDFIEARLPSYNILNLKLTKNFWLITFRILWFIGLSPNTESYSEVKHRAQKCSDKLIAAAQENESVIFVGHGILNRLISKDLRRRGWQGPARTKNNYWQFAIYESSIQYIRRDSAANPDQTI